MSEKRILIIAGPNGAGKTTLAAEYLPHEAKFEAFLNADMIAKGLSPFNPNSQAIRAARIMLDMEDRYSASGRSFAIETTLAGKGYGSRIRKWRRLGYHVTLIFIRLPDVAVAIDRVHQRVKEGGHSIPEDVIRRRFDRGWANFVGLYRDLVDSWRVIENVGGNNVIIERGENFE